MDATDLSRAAETVSDVSGVFDGVPDDAKRLSQYVPVISLFKTKAALVRAGLRTALTNAFVFSDGSVRVATDIYDIEALWNASDCMQITTEILTSLAGAIAEHIFKPLMTFKTARPASASDCEWSVTFPSLPSVSVEAVAEAIESLFKFLVPHVPHLPELVRRSWVPLAPQLENLFNISASLAALEQRLVDQGLLPADAPRRLISSWDKHERDRSSTLMTAALSDVRSRLVADVNRKTTHLRLQKSDRLRNTFVPRVVSAEAVRIANTYIANPSEAGVIANIVALFIMLRQPEFADPKSSNARHAGVFFNDCAYLSLALAVVPHSQFQPEIGLLRSAASRAMSGFLRRVAERGVHHLADGLKGALTDQRQVSDALFAIQQCIGEVSECNMDWKALDIDPSVVGLWNSTMLDAIMKDMIKLTTVCAKSAIAGSKSVKGLLSSSQTTNSGLWTVFRKFTEAAESLVPDKDRGALLTWAVVSRINIALSGTQTDIMGIDPWPSDEGLYGLSTQGYENLLACNPLLQGESKETFKRLLARFVIPTDDISPKKAPQFPEERNFAALFN